MTEDSGARVPYSFHSLPYAQEVGRHEDGIPLKASLVGKIRCIVASLIVCLGAVGVGTCMAYASPAVPNMDSMASNPFFIDAEAQSWVGSIVCLGSALGALFSGHMGDALGRKLALLVGTTPFAIGWAVIAAAECIPTLYIGRFITGIGKGLVLGIVPVYIAEISPVEMRGLLGAFNETSCLIGNLYVYTMGYFLTWRWLAVSCMALLVAMVFGVIFVPETPRWLLCKGRRLDAESSMQWLRGQGVDVRLELDQIECSLLDGASTKSATWRAFLSGGCGNVWAPLAKCIALFGVQQLCGNNVVKVYTVTILQDTGIKQMDPKTAAIIVGVVGVLGTLACVATVDIIGRKLLLLVSTAIMAVSMTGIGIFFYYAEADYEFVQTSLWWIPLMSLLMDNFFYAVGIGPITWTLTSELFPTKTRGKANAVAVCFEGLFAFISTKFFVNLTNVIQLSGGFWLCAVISIAGFALVMAIIPETRGKSLEQLQKDRMNLSPSITSIAVLKNHDAKVHNEVVAFECRAYGSITGSVTMSRH